MVSQYDNAEVEITLHIHKGDHGIAAVEPARNSLSRWLVATMGVVA